MPLSTSSLNQQQPLGVVLATFLAGVAVGVVTVLASSVRSSSSSSQPSKKDVDNHNGEEEYPAPRRFGGAIRLKPEKYKRYRELHDHVWDDVLQRMHRSNIRNFVIYYHQETHTLFHSFEWIGHWKNHDKANEQALLQADMDAIANDAVTRQWWKECEPCQIPFSQWKSGQPLLSDGGSGDWWAPLECFAHCGHWPTAYSTQSRDPDFVPLSLKKKAATPSLT